MATEKIVLNGDTKNSSIEYTIANATIVNGSID